MQSHISVLPLLPDFLCCCWTWRNIILNSTLHTTSPRLQKRKRRGNLEKGCIYKHTCHFSVTLQTVNVFWKWLSLSLTEITLITMLAFEVNSLNKCLNSFTGLIRCLVKGFRVWGSPAPVYKAAVQISCYPVTEGWANLKTEQDYSDLWRNICPIRIDPVWVWVV